jgi:hypothetical protein
LAAHFLFSALLYYLRFSILCARFISFAFSALHHSATGHLASFCCFIPLLSIDTENYHHFFAQQLPPAPVL